MRRSRSFRLLALLLGLLFFVAAACGDDDDDDDGGAGGSSTTSDEEVPEGGDLVLGAEQEPDCADWISSCAGASWGFWTMQVHTMPRAFDIVRDGDAWVYEPSILLEGEPELETDPKQVVTYNINPDAKWSDGEPITSKDFEFTWKAIAEGKDIYDPTGYVDIESVDATDPSVAVVTYSKPYAGWKALFGGGFGIYPAHILEGKDHVAEMGNGYEWSGGPWKIERWNKGVDVTLVPNDQYWGDVPKLDSVVFKFLADTATEFQAFAEGEVEAIYPQPQLDAVQQINEGIEGAESIVNAETASLEAIWFNNGQPPFDQKEVRQAIGYALDRDAIVARLFGDIGVEEASQSVDPPILSDLTDTEAWADYQPDEAKFEELLTTAGYEKGDDGFWAKDGERLSFELKTTTTNQRRELTQQVVQEQLNELGIEVTLSTHEAGDLFGDQLPKGDFQAAIYAQNLTSLEPGGCALFCSKNIPTAENGMVGQNWQRVNVPELDPLFEQVDEELDEEARGEAEKEAVGILAEEAALMPLDPLPNITLWSSDIAGPVGDHVIFSPFWNMNLWGLKQ